MKDGSRPGVRRRVEIAAFLLVFVWLLVVAATRVVSLAAPGALRLDASGEKRFLGWAYRDPKVLSSLSSVQPQLERGEAVFVTCTPGCEPGWIWVMAAYGLPAQAVVGAGSPRGPVGPTLLEWSRAGFRILPRRGADGGR
jgi:hypothetical protein